MVLEMQRLVDDVIRTARTAVSDAAAVTDDRVNSIRRAFGGGNCESVCDYCAAPFVHGPAITTEIHKLQAALDRFPEEAAIRRAHEHLRHFALDISTQPLKLPKQNTETGSNARLVVSRQLAKAVVYESALERDESALRERWVSERAAFLEVLSRDQ